MGDLYRLVLEKLKLPYQSADDIESLNCLPPGYSRAGGRFRSKKPWNTPDVWVTLKEIIVDQLQIKAGDVREDARFGEDLGSD